MMDPLPGPSVLPPWGVLLTISLNMYPEKMDIVHKKS